MSRLLLGALLGASLSAAACVATPPRPETSPVRPDAFAPACANPPPLVATAEGPAVAEALRGLAASIEGERQAGGLVGVAVAVVHGQTTWLAAGFGCADLERRSPVTQDTVYRIGAVTQVFDATALMQLRDAGRLRLDDAVQRSVPDVWYREASGAKLSPTWRQLASHTAGLPAPVPLGLETVSHLFRYLQSRTALTKPGTRYAYSELGSVVLGQSLAKVARTSYHELMRQHLFEPLGMTSTHYDAGSVDPDRLAVGYKRLELENDGWRGRRAASKDPFPLSGSILSSVSDMCRFLTLQLRDGSASRPPIVAVGSLRETWLPVARTDARGGSVGIGWLIRASGRVRVLRQDGGLPGFTARIELVPEHQLGLVAFVNETPRLQRERRHGIAQITRLIRDRLIPITPATAPPSL